MKLIKIFLTILIVFSINVSSKSQVINNQWLQTKIADYGYSIEFLNENTGFAGVISSGKIRIIKIVDAGRSWNSIWEKATSSQFVQIHASDENNLVVYLGNKVDANGQNVQYTTNGGIEWHNSSFNAFPPSYIGIRNSIMKFFDANTGYLSFAMYYYSNYEDYQTLYLYKTTDGGKNWIKCFQKQGNSMAKYEYEFTDLAFINNDVNNIILVGDYHIKDLYSQYGIFTVASTDGFNSTPTVICEPLYTDNQITYQNISTLPQTPSEIRIIIVISKDNEIFSKGTYCVNNNGNRYKICDNISMNSVNGLTFKNDNVGYAYIGNSIYMTTNSGINWIEVCNQVPIQNQAHYCISSKGDIVNAISYDGTLVSKGLSAFVRLGIDMNNYDYIGKFYINNVENDAPYNSYLRYGNYDFGVKQYLDNNQKLFYKWENNNSLKFSYPASIFNDGNWIYAAYKSKFISNTIKAISSIPTSVSTPSSTKAMRDINAVVHQIHESLGGIFYSRSSDGGTNFISEETVNYSTLKNDADANKNSSLNIIRDDSQNDGSNPLTSVDAENSVVACWERYNAATQRTEIMVSKRVDNTPHTGHEWHRFNNTGNNNEPVEVFHSFPSNTDFQSYPKVFSVATRNSSGDINPLENFVTLVVHLEPFPNANSSTKRLIVTGKTDNQYCEYVIDEGNISDISVTAPINHYKFFSMHFAYIKDNEVQYKLVTLGADILTDGNLHFIGMVNGESTIVSTSDGMQSRITPDISFRNNRPVITYRGYYLSNRYVQYPGNAEGTQILSIYHYPVIVKTRNGTNWDSFITYDGSTPQEEPNIEGSMNANGYILNFKKNNAYFQFAKIDGHSGYYCNPGTFQGTDAKLVRDSYIGEFGVSSNPMLLTLSQVTGSTYQVGKQSFSITNQINPVWQQDGFSNMGGTISKDKIDYIMNLGPIFVSNTIQNLFNDDMPPQTVQSIVEFNETMKSSLFGLNNNDTLILGTNGRYILNSGGNYQALAYHVNLVNYTQNRIEKELFKDTVRISDSVSTEFLRGFVITDLESSSDSFYVRLEVDTAASNETIDYGMAGIYSPGEVSNGDALTAGGYKTKVFFNNNIIQSKQPVIPSDFSLSQNYPNPFNPVTKINFAIQKQGLVTLKVYDLLGREVASLLNETKAAGHYTVEFDASKLSSGIYFYKLQTGSFTSVKKMVLVK
ncbi:MAG TPA: T9SS type A sorting domain-containing protein [Ignavibacteria bacterium]|nr:T9SS type A sorting domain-containing protein [Ignavibacteria bacterium]